MHELGTVYYIIKEVEKVCEENGLTAVGSVTVEIGEVSGIIPDYIIRCWDWAKKDTKYLKDCVMIVENLEAVTYCEDCGHKYSTMQFAKICPNCGSDHTYLLTGNEYNIKEIEAV